MTIKVLFFGRLRDAAGAGERIAAAPADVRTLAELRDWIARDEPELAAALAAPGVRAVRDQNFCALDTPLAGAREIAFVPPLSGG